MNAGEADFHGMTVTFRRRLLERLSVRFQLHLVALDRQRVGGRIGAGEQGAVHSGYLQPERVPRFLRLRHPPQLQRQLYVRSARRKGQMFLHDAPGWLDQIVGGWQISSIWRYSTALPSAVQGDLAYNTNYWLSSLAVLNTTTSLQVECISIRTESRVFSRTPAHPATFRINRRKARELAPRSAWIHLQRRYGAYESVPPAVGRQEHCSSARRLSMP